MWEWAVGGRVADTDYRQGPVGYSRKAGSVADRFEPDMKGRHYILFDPAPIVELPAGVPAWPPPVGTEVDTGECVA